MKRHGRSHAFRSGVPLDYSFSWNSHAEHEMYMPPGTFRSASFTRFTTRVGLPHLGQSVDFVVSITFLRSAVFAIFAITNLLTQLSVAGLRFSEIFGSNELQAGQAG
jgi:hypothetical protein